MKRQRVDEQEIEEMRPTAWRPDGTPTKFEIMQREPAHLPTVVDSAPIVSPIQPDRVPRVQHIITGTPLDEAKAFNHKTNNLAMVLSGGGVLVALLFGASLTAFTGIMLQAALYASVWLIAYLVDVLRSPGGVELFHAWNLWAYLKREQSHRHGKVEYGWDMTSVILTALVVSVVVMVTVGMVVMLAQEYMPR